MISIKDLVLAIDGNPVLKKINAQFTIGQIYGICGPNGAGKSSLLRCLLGLQIPTNGGVFVDNQPVEALSGSVLRNQFCWVPDSQPIPPGYSVADVMSWGQIYSKRPSDQNESAILSSLQSMDLISKKNAKASSLSQGEFKRLQIARALASEAQFLIFDEPTAPLDLSNSKAFGNALKETVGNQKKSVILTSHDLNFLLRFADQVSVMNQGELLETDVPSRLFLSEKFSKAFKMSTEILNSPHGKVIHSW
ncbi:MAG: ABC transporter ATP-binding protein [Proteobacteria bacterium]|nr:ABC transporter ATP-binding protein [Pseudomonadota bacterium]